MSVLLFWYDNPHKGDFYDKEKGTFTICRTQEDIQEQACNQIDVKTIHDVAVPFLQLFGFLDIKEKMYGNIYTIHIRRVEQAFAAFSKSAQTLKQFLKSSLQLEKFLIELTEDELEKTLINKRKLLFQLEKVLIRNREISNCKRGRKPRPQAMAAANSSEGEIYRDSIEIDTKRNKGGAFAPADFLPSEEIESAEDDEPTAYRLPAIKLNGKTPSQQTLPPVEPAAPETPAVGGSSKSAQEAAPEEKKETAKQRKARLDKRKDEILALYCELLGRKIVRTKDNLDGAKLLAESDATDAEITQTYQTYKDHSFWGRQLHLRNIARLLDTTVTSGNGHIPTAAKPKARPKPEDRNVSIFETDPYWQVWGRPGEDQEWIWWQGEFCTPEEADERGYGGGFGLYEGHAPQQQQYGGVH